MGVEEEVEAPGGVLAGRARERVEDHRRLLPLEAVDGAHSDPFGNSAPDAPNREVVRGDHEDVFWAYGACVSVGVRHAGPGEQIMATTGDHLRLLWACLAAAVVLDRQAAEADA